MSINLQKLNPNYNMQYGGDTWRQRFGKFKGAMDMGGGTGKGLEGDAKVNFTKKMRNLWLVSIGLLLLFFILFATIYFNTDAVPPATYILFFMGLFIHGVSIFMSSGSKKTYIPGEKKPDITPRDTTPARWGTILACMFYLGSMLYLKESITDSTIKAIWQFNLYVIIISGLLMEMSLCSNIHLSSIKSRTGGLGHRFTKKKSSISSRGHRIKDNMGRRIGALRDANKAIARDNSDRRQMQQNMDTADRTSYDHQGWDDKEKQLQKFQSERERDREGLQNPARPRAHHLDDLHSGVTDIVPYVSPITSRS